MAFNRFYKIKFNKQLNPLFKFHMYGQPNPMMMQAQMGSMGMLGGMGGMGGIGMLGNLGPNSGMFFYAGNAIGLESRIEDALNQNMHVTDVSITVTGNQVK
jgi:hypothetical protein